MNQTRLAAFLIMTVVASAWVLGATETKKVRTPDDNGIVWYNYQDGWEKAKSENKHLFVDFTATWCGWCKRLEQTTFSVPEVAKMLNEDFVPVKVWEKSTDTAVIDGYKIAERDLARREFRVTGYPSLWFVSPKGARIGPAGGYVDAATMMKYLDIVKFYRYDSTLDEQGNPKKVAEADKEKKK